MLAADAKIGQKEFDGFGVGWILDTRCGMREVSRKGRKGRRERSCNQNDNHRRKGGMNRDFVSMPLLTELESEGVPLL
jgi:hypothetical protein